MTGPWRCDTCGQLIEDPCDGAVQWLRRSAESGIQGRDLRIVHYPPTSPLGGLDGCYPDRDDGLPGPGFSITDQRLDDMVGPDGLVRLLALVASGEIPAPEVHRVIMRLFVPNYEQARGYFDHALDAEVVEQQLPEGYFYQEQLRAIVAYIQELHESS